MQGLAPNDDFDIEGMPILRSKIRRPKSRCKSEEVLEMPRGEEVGSGQDSRGS